MYSLAPVIGCDEKVRVGSLDELKYFCVMPLTLSGCGDHKGPKKVFYLSPKYYPGYEELISTDKGKRIVSIWQRRQDESEYVFLRK
jgi:hypothetical protein